MTSHGDFVPRPPAPYTAVDEAQRTLGVEFPSDYLAFLSASNGGEGDYGQAYLQLWAIEELTRHYEGYEIREFWPGFLPVGSSGGDELLGFDTRARPWSMVMIPACGGTWQDAIPLGASFTAFLARAKARGLFGSR